MKPVEILISALFVELDPILLLYGLPLLILGLITLTFVNTRATDKGTDY